LAGNPVGLVLADGRNNGDSQPGSDKAVDDGQVVGLERHARSEASCGTELVTMRSKLPGGPQHHEALVSNLCQRDRGPTGVAMVRRDSESQGLGEQTLPLDLRVTWTPSRELKVDAAAGNE